MLSLPLVVTCLLRDAYRKVHYRTKTMNTSSLISLLSKVEVAHEFDMSQGIIEIQY